MKKKIFKIDKNIYRFLTWESRTCQGIHKKTRLYSCDSWNWFKILWTLDHEHQSVDLSTQDINTKIPCDCSILSNIKFYNMNRGLLDVL